MYARETFIGFPLHIKSPARRRPILRSKNACSKKPPLAAAPSGASQAFCRRQNLGAGGIHFRRAVLIPLGWSDQGERNPKIKDRQRRSFIFVTAHRFCCPCALLYVARKGMCARETLVGFPLHIKSPARRRPILRSKNACSKKPPLAAAPSGASQAFCRRQNLGAGGIHFRRAVLIPLGWSDQGERNPKIKDRQRRSFIFGAGYGNRTRLLGLGSRCTTDVLTLRSEAIIAENFVHCNRKMPFGMIFLFYA